MNWFEKIFGFRETPQNIKDFISVDGNKLFSSANNKEFSAGKLSVRTLKELRTNLPKENGSISLNEIIGNVAEIHRLPENAGALFQVASQFNLLEMIGPNVTPEKGITIYQNDLTQGPSCAMACPAGTLYRNYFSKVNTLDEIESLFPVKYWIMKNGYALFIEEDLLELNELIQDYRLEISELLKVGVQWDTEVNNTNHLVSQVYCSALPIAYHYDIDSDLFEEFARLILDATYEAAFISAILNKKSNKLFLTMVGAGAFGNDRKWVMSAIEKNIEKFNNYNLDITMITYGYTYNKYFQNLINI